jgi:D-glycero-alpha-D-manno-heptose-7-phosphate kinase
VIISRTPLRMSFVGGGSDFPSFYRKYGGAVVSTSISKYVYITVNKKFDDHIRVSYSKTEEVEFVAQIEHKIVREVLKKLEITGGVEITSIADIPSRGTGLGSSSAFTVGLLHALHAYKGQYISADDLACQSCIVEIDRCGEPIGKQDQYAVSYGGLNFITFDPDDTISVAPIICRPDTVERLQAELMAFYTGLTRSASDLLKQQTAVVEQDRKKQKVLQEMVKLAYTLRDELHKNHVETLGEILHESWMLKKSITDGISNPVIDQWYERARRSGATGGKLLGAGGGGFLIFVAPEHRHADIIEALPELRPVALKFERSGSRIIFYSE